MPFTTYLEHQVLNSVLNGASFTSPGTSLYAALFTSDPGASGSAGTEVSGSGYSRIQADNWGTPSNGSINNDADINFGYASGGNWGTITHAAIYDASSGGNMLFYGALPVAKTVSDGDGFILRQNQFSVTFNS